MDYQTQPCETDSDQTRYSTDSAVHFPNSTSTVSNGENSGAADCSHCRPGKLCPAHRRERGRKHTQKHREKVSDERSRLLDERNFEQAGRWELQGELVEARRSLSRIAKVCTARCPNCKRLVAGSFTPQTEQTCALEDGKDKHHSKYLTFLSTLKFPKNSVDSGHERKRGRCKNCLDETCAACKSRKYTSKCRQKKEENLRICAKYLSCALEELAKRRGQIRCLRSQIEGIFKNLAVATCGSCGYDFSPVHAQHNQHSQGLVATNSIAASFYEPGQLVARDQSDTLRQTGEQVGLSVGFTEEEVHGLSNPHALASKAHSRPAEMAQRNINRPFSLDLINEYIQEENNREQVTGSSQYRTNDNNIVRYALVYEESNRQGEAVSEIEGILSQLQLGGFGSPGQTQVPHQTSICAESIQQPIRFSANDITHYELEDHSTDSDYDTLSVVSEATTLSLAHGDLRRSFSARSRGGLSFSRGPAGEEPKSSASEMTKNLEVIDETKELETIPTQGRSMASTWPVHVIKPEAIVRSKEKVVMQYVQLSRATLKVADNEDPIAVTLKEPLVKFSIMKGRNMLKYPHQWGRMKVEAELLSRLNHPNVVSCYGICLKPRPAAMFEACEGGTLKDLYKSLRYTDVITIVGWLTQIASGMAHLHKNGITMKNSYLNTQNISLKQQACRGGQDKRHPPCRGICDGDGNCVICGGRSLDRITLKIMGIGIDSCALQEVLLPNMGNARRAQAANDVYSFGMVQWELMNNLMLRHDETKGLRTPQTASNIVENCLPDALKDIALKCSSKVSHRPTFDECVEMLADARQSLLGSSRWRFSHSAKTSDGYQHAAPSVYAPNFLRQ